MPLNHTNEQISKNNKRVVVKLGLSLNTFSVVLGLIAQCVVSAPIAQAQGLAPDSESLLPPEVIPLDSAAANQMSQSQAQSRAASMGNTAQSVPGLGGNDNAPQQSAQEFRNSAFNSLMGQNATPAQAQFNPNFQSMAGQPGQLSQMPGQSGSFGQPGGPSNQSGQSGWITPGTTASQMNGGMQSQTLSGGVRNPQVGKPSKLNGLRHTVGLATALGGGIMTGAMMGGSSSMGYYSMGLMGMGLANYGLRNSFLRY